MRPRCRTDLIGNKLNDDCKPVTGKAADRSVDVLEKKVEEKEEANEMCPDVNGFIVKPEQAVKYVSISILKQ